MTAFRLPYEYIPRPDRDRATNGELYIGRKDVDPTIPGNQVQVRVVQEDGTLVNISQPITIGFGGIPLYNGSPANLDVDADIYSLRIIRNGVQIYNTPAVYPPVLTSETQSITHETIASAIADNNSSRSVVVPLDRGADSVWRKVSSDAYNMQPGAQPFTKFTDSAGNFFILDNTELRPEMFGAVGDGNGTGGGTDNSTSFANGILLNRKIAGDRSKIYRITTPLSHTYIDFEGVRLDFNNGNGSSPRRELVRAQGSITAKVSFGGGAGFAAGATRTSQIFPIGSLIVISNEEDAFSANPAENVFKGELLKITRVEGGFSYFNRAVKYTISNAFYQVITPAFCRFVGNEIMGSGFSFTASGEVGIAVRYCENPQIQDNEFPSVERFPILIDQTLFGDVSRNNIVMLQTDPDQSSIDNSIQYGIAIFNATSELHVHHNTVAGGKHPIDFTQNNTDHGYGIGNIIESNTLSACWHAAISTHDANAFTEIKNNNIFHAMRGIESRTPDNNIVGNNIETTITSNSAGGEGIYLTKYANSCLVEDNDVRAFTHGIRLNAGTTCDELIITNNRIHSAGSNIGIRFDTTSANHTISGNVGRSLTLVISAVSPADITGCIISENVSATGVAVHGEIGSSIIRDNTRLGNGLVVQLTGTPSDNLITQNNSLNGNPISSLDTLTLFNLSKDTSTTETTQGSGSFLQADVLERGVTLTNSLTDNLRYLRGRTGYGMYVLHLASGSLIVQHGTDTADAIRTADGSNYTWNSGTPLVLARTEAGWFMLNIN